MKKESGKSFFLLILRKISEEFFSENCSLGISYGKAALAKCIDRKVLENSKHSRHTAVPSKTRSIALEVKGVAYLEHCHA